MPKPHLSHRLMPAVALSTLLVISTLPATSWLVRSQVQAQFSPLPGVESASETAGLSPEAQAHRDAPALRAEAARHPDDFQAQVAAAIVAPPPGDGSELSRRIHALEALAPRFPDQPSLYAHILRFETEGPVVVNRKEETILTGEPLGIGLAAHHAAPAVLADFDRNAAIGERLDPDNAYFPLMRAAGLFAGHRDMEAVAAIERAGQKRVWNDYTAEEAAATLHLYTMAFGRSSAITRTSLDYQILLPHLSQIRAVARMAAFWAMYIEQAGNLWGGS